MNLNAAALAHLDDVLDEWKRLASGCHEEDFNNLGDTDETRFIMRACAVSPVCHWDSRRNWRI
jgi:hypothetical protein